MTDRPWESEPHSLEFEADGLACVMRRNDLGVWCGYVGVGQDHPLFGLPTNHPLKLPTSWFRHRRGLEGTGVFDIFMHAMSGKALDEACPIAMALQVHGGVNFADDHPMGGEPGERWWFGFDCGHAGDLVPGVDFGGSMEWMLARMPEEIRGKMRDIITNTPRVYRDQQYVVGECQSLAAQLVAIVDVIKCQTPVQPSEG